jgi:hypothetical protein
MVENDRKLASTREAVGVFDDAKALEAAIGDLLAAGFERAQISLLAGEKAIVEKLGHTYVRVEELEDDLAAPRIKYRSMEASKMALLGALASIGALAAAGAIFAGGGALAATLGSGVIGAEVGGFLSGVFGDFLDSRHARYLQEQLDHGGLLLFVRCAGDGEENLARETLLKRSGRDVHAHALAEGAAIGA